MKAGMRMSFLEQMDEVFKSKWKFEREMPIQSQMIPLLLEGKDVVAESPTGTGKTLAYVLPILQMVQGSKQQTQALIMSPSQELSMQIVNVIREWINGTDITVTQLIGGANMQRQIEKLKKKPTIVVGTPGRIVELVKAKRLKMHEIKHIVLDEGDQLLSRDYRVIVKDLIDSANPERQVVVVSATITDEIEHVAKRMMDEPVRLKVSLDDMPLVGNVTHSFIKTEIRNKTDLLRGLSHLPSIRALAFMNNVDQLRMKELKLQYNEAPIAVLYSNMSKFERQQTLEDFRKGKIHILIATDLAARGLDIEGLTHVIHVDIPHTIEQYLHRSGRTGRAGQDGEVLTLLTYPDEKTYRKLTKGLKPVQKIYYKGKLMEGNAKTKDSKPNSPKSKSKKGRK